MKIYGSNDVLKGSDSLSSCLGKSLFVLNLIKANHYREIFSQEYVRIPSQENPAINGRVFQDNNL